MLMGAGGAAGGAFVLALLWLQQAPRRCTGFQLGQASLLVGCLTLLLAKQLVLGPAVLLTLVVGFALGSHFVGFAGLAAAPHRVASPSFALANGALALAMTGAIGLPDEPPLQTLGSGLGYLAIAIGAALTSAFLLAGLSANPEKRVASR